MVVLLQHTAKPVSRVAKLSRKGGPALGNGLWYNFFEIVSSAEAKSLLAESKLFLGERFLNRNLIAPTRIEIFSAD